MDIKTVLNNIEHLIPALEEDQVPVIDIAVETPSTQSASSLQSPYQSTDQSPLPSQTAKSDTETVEQDKDHSDQSPLPSQSAKSDTETVEQDEDHSDQSQVVSENQELNVEQSEAVSSNIDTEPAQSGEFLQTPKVTFTTGSDTEEEVEPDSKTQDFQTPDVNTSEIDSIDLSNLNIEPADSFNVNIDTDLSALAADVLTGHSNRHDDEEKKKD